jgi:hypothetical protein
LLPALAELSPAGELILSLLMILYDPGRRGLELIRDKTWDWYKSDLYTRLKPGGRIVLIQTRWHEDDLAGRLLADMARAAISGRSYRSRPLPKVTIRLAGSRVRLSGLNGKTRTSWTESGEQSALETGPRFISSGRLRKTATTSRPNG